ncbi:uncharacterized protein BDZ99DRAFT_480768 [Mytilinidion resinicola]|uniref:Vacuolar ATPase assembly protein VMA22 n=1 Tax=Mytilinidion resinicola TaxID=574789 RepID=A0A6A6Y9M1_9PEZI|nr:uncharacterized protein BDZ99DRAFT_480768 [Mytilinidion resinicola]KAF2805390.1 hypothetical protein BDZ99DRAFT_480768 [Mytilinidion resinicola]
MSLAQANYHNRTRFGQDYYDERMQASRHVSLQMKDDVPSFTVSKSEPQETLSKDESEKPGAPEQPSKNEPQADRPEPSEKTSDVRSSDENPTSTKSVDPIRWFGILVPPALRSAQSSFVSAIEGPIPRLATLSKELRNLQIEIGRARKRLRKIEG